MMVESIILPKIGEKSRFFYVLRSRSVNTLIPIQTLNITLPTSRSVFLKFIWKFG